MCWLVFCSSQLLQIHYEISHQKTCETILLQCPAQGTVERTFSLSSLRQNHQFRWKRQLNQLHHTMQIMRSMMANSTVFAFTIIFYASVNQSADYHLHQQFHSFLAGLQSINTVLNRCWMESDQQATCPLHQACTKVHISTISL